MFNHPVFALQLLTKAREILRPIPIILRCASSVFKIFRSSDFSLSVFPISVQSHCRLSTSPCPKSKRKPSRNTPLKSYFLCGPPGMYEFCLAELEKLKIPARKIKREMFGAPLNIWDYPGWPSGIDQNAEFTLSVNGREVPVVAKESILTALEREGLVVPTACRSGVCSMCRIKLLSGKIYQPPSTPVRKSDRQFGYIHSCVSYPLEDVAVLL